MDDSTTVDGNEMKQSGDAKDGSAEILLDRLLHIVRDETRDLNLRQLAVLLICQSATEPQTIRGLAKQLSIFKPSVTRAVDRLEQSGLARRKIDPSDRRSVLVLITPAGRKYCSTLNRQGSH